MFKKARRIPRKIGGDADDAVPADGAATTDNNDSSSSLSAVKRPTISSRSSTKPKQSSSLRTSLAFDEGDGDDSSHVVVKKTAPKVSRRITDRTAELLRDREPLPVRDHERPSYSADYLAELKNSTPTTPANLSSAEDDNLPPSPPARTTLDITSKFGSDAITSTHVENTTTAIPSAAEILEKKQRRARLAKEQDYISLNDPADQTAADDSPLSDDEFAPRRSLIIPAEVGSKYDPDTRLIHDDENLYEDFEDYTEDSGKVAVSRRVKKEQEVQRRKDIAEQIRAAQHGYGYGAGVSGDEASDDDNDEVDEEEAARNAAYEAAQTRAGTYSTSTSAQRERAREERARKRFEVQPRLQPIPELKSVVGRFWEMVRAKEAEIELGKRRLERVAKERVEMGEEEVKIKSLLKEAGERYEKLRMEESARRNGKSAEAANAGLESAQALTPAEAATPASGEEMNHEDDGAEAGLEAEAEEDAEEEDVQPPASGFGLGFNLGPSSTGMSSGAGLGFSGMSAPRSAEDDW